MKRFLSYISVVSAFLFLTACTDTHYLAEKLFWQAGKKTKELVSKKRGKLTLKDYEEIVSYYREAINKVPLDSFAAKAHFAIADLFLRQLEPDKAQKELREIINNFSSFYRSKYFLCNLNKRRINKLQIEKNIPISSLVITP